MFASLVEPLARDGVGCEDGGERGLGVEEDHDAGWVGMFAAVLPSLMRREGPCLST